MQRLGLDSLSLALTVALLGATAAAQAPVDFNSDVRPLLSDRCFRCHGPDAGNRKARLRLDTEEGALAPRRRGAAVVPGDAAASLLVQRLRHADPEKRMPPADSGKTLSAEQRDLLARWIDQGAVWERHWAFEPVSDPPLPPDDAWSRNELDRFVQARLREQGLSPSPPADRRTLLRRVSLDLTGLPPTPEEVDAFVADRGPDAYERVVDRLLASERYGEHMARFWLDAARYGDSHGLHLDNYREMWPYRDWVIGAFNDNLPYDAFTVQQLAGDLLPGGGLAEQIASGFNRCHVTTNEGGSIKEEVYVRNVVDRVSTFGTVFLGMTLGCAVCHDHKFDPITQRDFYQLFAFFNNLDGDAMDGNATAHPPVVRVPTGEQAERQQALERDLAAAEADIAEALAAVVYEEPATADDDAARREIVWIDDALPAGALAEGDGLAWVEAPREHVHSGRLAMLRRSHGNQQHLFRHADTKLRIGLDDELFAWLRLDPDDPPRQVMLQWNADGGSDWDHRAFWGEDLIPYGTTGTPSRRRLGDLPQPGVWTRLAVPAAAVGLPPGSAVHGVAFTQWHGTAQWDTVGLVTATPQEPADRVWVDDEVPAGAKPQGDGQTWHWVEGPDHPVLAGSRSLRRSGGGGLNQDYFTDAPALRVQHGDRLFAHVWLDPDDPPRGIQLQFHSGGWGHRARWGEACHGGGADGGADHVAGPLPAARGAWVRLEVGLAEVGLKPGDHIDGWAFTQQGGTVYWDRAGVHTWAPPDPRTTRSLAVWQRAAAADPSLPEPVRAALQVAADARSEQQQRLVREHFLRHVHDGTRATFAPLEQRVRGAREDLTALRKAMPTTLVMVERKEPRPAYLLRRGHYDARGEQLERRTPAVLPPMADDLPRDRLGLARWLVSPEHPLTARVAVNRFFGQVFGRGLVRTSEDFGNQGEPPSHPQLLDWLARDFVEHGWDVKRLMRTLVTSATYRQDSRATPELLQHDPANRWFARGPRFRLDAETLRDQALAVSGLLVEEIGGPGVKPPQPAGLWQAVGYVGSNTDRFRADTGPDKVHRRSLYTFFKRTAPPPQLSTFDAPSREVCVVRRERTNTPLQALLLLNDPQFVEAARALAQRVLGETAEAGDSQRIQRMVALVLGRPATEADAGDLLELLHTERAAFARDADAARALLAVGEAPRAEFDPTELAAWTLVANTLLNLHETVTKG